MNSEDVFGLVICGIIILVIFGVIEVINIHHTPDIESKILQSIDCKELKNHIKDLIIQNKIDDEIRAKDLYNWNCEP